MEFLSQALSEVGTALGESVIPLSVSDENVLQGIITDHGKLFLNTRRSGLRPCRFAERGERRGHDRNDAGDARVRVHFPHKGFKF